MTTVTQFPLPLPTDVLLAKQTIARRARAVLCVTFGVLLTLCMEGYQFGRSNHTVYLLDALRHASPNLLQNDWFSTQTLQYHAAFGWLTRGLMQAGMLKSGFLVGYLVLLILLHAGWWRLVRLLGGGAGAFVISEVIFHVSGGGTALGLYQFLQDGCFLPSNIAAVAMLWGIVMWLSKQRIPAGAWFGIAGLFHLNYALVGMMLWVLLAALEFRRDRSVVRSRAMLIASGLAMLPSLVNIAFALRATSQHTGAMPLKDFVDLYVRLRHPHHYDPSSWPAWQWISFLWPMPLMVMFWLHLRRTRRITNAWREGAGVFAIFFAIVLIALVGAGLFYVSETLVQASLYRFSIFLKLFSCIGAGFLIYETAALKHRPQAAPATALGIGLITLALCVWRGPYLGLFRIPFDESRYELACDWVRQNTPIDAVFVVPPHEQEFRLRAQRAIVVNFKGVPQLSGELPEWRNRLENVMDLTDLRDLPGPFPQTLRALRDRYAKLPPEHLEKVARQYGARYIVAARQFPPQWEPRRIDINANQSWFLYDLSR
jgi:hypothetical protein